METGCCCPSEVAPVNPTEVYREGTGWGGVGIWSHRCGWKGLQRRSEGRGLRSGVSGGKAWVFLTVKDQGTWRKNSATDQQNQREGHCAYVPAKGMRRVERIDLFPLLPLLETSRRTLILVACHP